MKDMCGSIVSLSLLLSLSLSLFVSYMFLFGLLIGLVSPRPSSSLWRALKLSSWRQAKAQARGRCDSPLSRRIIITIIIYSYFFCCVYLPYK